MRVIFWKAKLFLDLVVVWLRAPGPHVDPAPVSGDDHILLKVSESVVETVPNV